MVSSLIPNSDLVPSVTSRVVTINAVDLTEGAPIDGEITFSLCADLHVAADDKIIAAGSKTLTLADGKASIRLPCYDSDAVMANGSRDWVILVHKSWDPSHPYGIRVPSGTTNISLADIPATRPLTGREKQYAITGVSVDVTVGAQAGVASGTGRVTGGILDLDLTIPPAGAHSHAWADIIVKQLETADLDNIRSPGYYYQSASGYASKDRHYPTAQAGSLRVTGNLDGLQVQQVYVTFRPDDSALYWRSYYSGAWGPWHKTVDTAAIDTVALGSENLDTVRTPGRYYQSNSAVTTAVNNYPVTQAGALTVTSDKAGGQVQQTYLSFHPENIQMWMRAYYFGTWGPWKQVGTGDAASLRAAIEAEAQAREEADARIEAALENVSSAYDLAVKQGFVGTVDEWLESLKGTPGPEGPYGGTSVADPQVASWLLDTATETGSILDANFLRTSVSRASSAAANVLRISDSDAGAGARDTVRLEDSAEHSGSLLRVDHKSDGRANPQSYGLNVANHPGAAAAFVIHQYSNRVAFQLDNTDIGTAIFVKNTANQTMNPGGTGTGAFLQFMPYGQTSSVQLTDSLTWLNFTSKDMSVNAMNPSEYAFGVRTDADGKTGLQVSKNGSASGDAVRVVNKGTGFSIVASDGKSNRFSVSSNGEIEIGTPGAGVILRSTNGKRFRIVVDDAGNLSTQDI